MRIAWLAVLLLCAACPARQETRDVGRSRQPLTASPERALATTTFVPSAVGNDQVSVAFDGTQFLAVWRIEQPDRVVAARVTPQGVLLDPEPIELGFGRVPQVVFGDGKFRVVWDAANATKFARILPDGTVLDPGGVTAVDGIHGGGGPTRIAHAAGTTLITWYRSLPPYGNTLFGARVLESGVPLDANAPLLLAAPPPQVLAFAVAGSASQFAVAWSTGTFVWIARVSTAGVTLDKGGFVIGTGYRVAVGSDGTDFLATSADPFTDELRVTRFTAAGQIASSTQVPNSHYGATGSAAVAHNGSNYVVVWDVGQTVEMARVSDTGSVLDPVPIGVTRSSYFMRPDLACGPANCLVTTLMRDPPVLFRAVGFRVSATGNLLDAQPLALSVEPANQLRPAVVWNGSHFVVAWTDEDGGAWATRVALDAGVLEEPAVFVGALGPVSLASNGTDVLVAGRDPLGRPAAVRIGSDGNPRDVPPIVVAAGPASPHVVAASVGPDFLVGWDDKVNSTRLVRVSGDGGLLDTDGGTLLPLLLSQSLRLSSDDENYVVTWTSGGTLQVARFSPGGGFVGAPAAPYLDVSTAFTDFDGTNHFALWQGASGVRTGRFSSTGVAFDQLDGVPVPPEGGAVYFQTTALTFDGTQHLVVSDSPPRLKRFTSDGGFLDVRVLASPESSDLEPLSIASDRAGHSLLVRPVRDSFGRKRLIARVIDGQPTVGLGQPCAWQPDCAEGHCVDGVCCDTPCGGGPGDCLACSVDAGAQADGVCGVVTSGFFCRPNAGACDVAERCDGVSTACPSDQFASAATVCRPKHSFWICDVAEYCTGVGSSCPADAYLPKDMPCDDLTACTTGDRCVGIQCLGNLLPEGSECSTGTACLGSGRCRTLGGEKPKYCVETPTYPCMPRVCNAGTCSPLDGGCLYTPVADGIPCFVTGTCIGGECVPAEPMPEPDAGEVEVPDAGSIPKKPKPDAGTVPSPSPAPRGCGCSTGAVPLLLAALLLTRRARTLR